MISSMTSSTTRPTIRATALLTTLCLLPLCLLSAGPALAQGIDYSYVELRYINRDLGVFFESGGVVPTTLKGDDGDGYGFAGSLLLLRNVYITGEYISGVDIDLNTVLTDGSQTVAAGAPLETKYARLGIGLRVSLIPGVDAFGEVAYERTDLNFDGIDVTFDAGGGLTLAGLSVDENGLDYRAGLRFMLGTRLELMGYARFTEQQLSEISIDSEGNVELGDETVYGGAVTYKLSRNLGIGATYESGDLDKTSAYVRLSF